MRTIFFLKIVQPNKFIVPEFIKNRTINYLEKSCSILQWFKENYKQCDNTREIQIKDIHENFRSSDLYDNMTKVERRKNNLSSFVEYFQSNPYFKDSYRAKNKRKQKNILVGWDYIDDENSNDSDAIDNDEEETIGK
jgi:hypothetical protein